MADLSNVTFQPQNPDALFSPDQWRNADSLYNDRPLPWPSSYVGWPTDAMGNPIGGGPSQQMQAPSAPPAQSAPGTTINSTPAAAGAGGQINYAGLGSAGPAIQELMGNYAAAQAKLSPQQQYNQAQTRAMDTRNAQNIANLNMNRTAGGGFGAGNNVINSGPNYASPMQTAPQQAAPQAVPAGPGGLTYPQVLALLANPGKVTTPGATVPASATSAQPGGGVNNAFLGQAQGRPGMNQNFLSALAALQGRGRG